jgi:hypothetical protein
MFMEKFVKERESNDRGCGIYKTKKPSMIWCPDILCDPMKQVLDRKLPGEVKDCYYRPVSGNQRLYDAVIMRENEREPVDVLQITIGEGDFEIEEFQKLFDWRVNQNKPLNFRFVMIRVARNESEWRLMMARPMEWSIPSSTKKVPRILEQVQWFECVFNLQEALVEFRKSELGMELLEKKG